MHASHKPPLPAHLFELPLADTLEQGAATGDAQIASRVYGFDSTDMIVTVLLIFAFTMLLLLVLSKELVRKGMTPEETRTSAALEHAMNECHRS